MRNWFDLSKVNVAPCKDCKNRKVGCHASCEAYKEWKVKTDSLYHSIRDQEDSARKLDDYEIQRSLRYKKRRERR